MSPSTASTADPPGATPVMDRPYSGEAHPPDHFTEYLVNAPPAWLSEFGPSAA